MNHRWKQLSLAVCDAQMRLDIPGYIAALQALELAALTARLELLAALEPKPEPEPEPSPPPEPSPWQQTADEWGQTLLVLREKYSCTWREARPCIEYVVAECDADDFEKHNAIDRVTPAEGRR